MESEFPGLLIPGFFGPRPFFWMLSVPPLIPVDVDTHLTNILLTSSPLFDRKSILS